MKTVLFMLVCIALGLHTQAQNWVMQNQCSNFGGQSCLFVDTTDNTLYSGGASFVNLNGDTINGICKWENGTWIQVGDGITIEPYGVRRIGKHKGKLIVGGGFWKTGSGKTVNCMAWFDGTVWQNFGLGVYPTSMVWYPYVMNFYSYNDTLHITGNLTHPMAPYTNYFDEQYNNFNAYGVYNDTCRQVLGYTGAATVSLHFKNRMYLGGSASPVQFDSTNKCKCQWRDPIPQGAGHYQRARCAMRMLTDSGEVFAFPVPTDAITALYAEDTNYIYMGTTEGELYRYDDNTKQVTRFGNNIKFDGEVHTITRFRGDIVVAGHFNNDSLGNFLGNVARFDGTNWHPIASNNFTTNNNTQNFIWDLVVYDSTLIAVGSLVNCGVASIITIASFPSAIPVGTPKVAKPTEVLSVYPNPANEQLTIQLSQALGNYTYTLVNVYGTTVAQQSFSTTSTLVTNALVSGLYLLRITNNYNQTVATSKVAIVH